MNEPELKEPVEAKTPQVIQQLEWVRRYGWKYKFHILILILVSAWWWAPIVVNSCSSLLVWVKGEKLVATIIDFKQENKSVALLFDNRTSNPVVIEEIYFTMWHRGLVGCFKVLQGADRRGAPDDCLVFRVPAFGGFEIIGDQPRLNVSLLSSRLSIAPKSQVITNLVASSDSFHCAVDCFIDRSPLDLGVQFRLLRESEEWHEVHLPLGTYASESGASSLVRGDSLWAINLLPSPRREWKERNEHCLMLNGTNWVEMPWKIALADHNKLWRRITVGSNSVLIAIAHPKPDGTITPHF
jgi:hypothetical protein